MKLRILTPTEVVLEQDAVHVTAEDQTGSLGIRPGHASLVTALVPGIVQARTEGGSAHSVAVNGGVMLVGGDLFEITGSVTLSAEAIDTRVADMKDVRRGRLKNDRAEGGDHAVCMILITVAQ